ncbi:hypothetical protein EJ06DRAFT_35391 [Trichodelitschia bisporula]|uniref:Uncharacterized protein n=1 Tax=Trichodelitschia bisporula TaxID=703511 RepID=A0A6G1HUR0_9PEZI|nr:hypothetical protein EJ06DRAFT_35391 [Trichodelitschia bisporula]
MAKTTSKPPRAPFPGRKRFVVPLWILQIIIGLVIVFLSTVALAVKLDDETKEERKKIQGIALYYIFFGAIVLILTIVEPILFCAHRLSPLVFLIFHAVKTTEVGNTAIVIVLTVFLIIFIASFLYALVTWRHARRDAKYQVVANPDQPLHRESTGTEYAPYAGYGFKAEAMGNDVYEMQHAPVQHEIDGRPAVFEAPDGRGEVAELPAAQMPREQRVGEVGKEDR